MRSPIVCTLLFALSCFMTPDSARAQENSSKDRGQGYLFAGFGAINTNTSVAHFGAGGEVNLYKGLGFGVEVGYLAPTQYWGGGIGILSVDGQYTFNTGSPRRLKPFLTGGYTLAFRSGHANAMNIGGGVHYWFARHGGLRLEFRDHVSPDLWNAQAWQVRVGFDFR